MPFWYSSFACGRKGEVRIMKTVRHYVYETCGTVYADKAKAAECEKGHKAPEKIIRTRYAPVSGDRTGYPQTLEVLMDDGKTATYKRTGGR